MEYAASLGLAAGVAGVDPLTELQQRLEKRAADERVTPFEEKEPSLRVRPDHLLPGCRSIIVLAMPYPDGLDNIKDVAPGPRGEVARCARVYDYHLLLQQKAELLASLVCKELAAATSYRILIDRSPLVERELARLAGLGQVGENCTLITPGSGSFTALGTILLDQPLDASKPLTEGCLHCGKCRESCPTGAILSPYILDPFRCLSYLTQASGTFPHDKRRLLGPRLYGCDRCQEVCPLNNQSRLTSGRETHFSLFPARPLLLPLLRITKKEFEQTIALTSAGWRGKTTLQRNAVIALGNSRMEEAVPELSMILENDPRTTLRQHAAWSLGQIGGAKARRRLELSARHEQDLSVKKEVRDALE